ncbi:MAG: type IV pilus modification protein PilV [Enterobacterales bacterium]|nr:type IV pilus modification protein PilV [Enterobacterales bacterium]
MTLIKLKTANNRQAGVSLIEILVTTLILGIGLLGVASLQVASVSSNQEGFFRSQATSIAEELSSRIRSSKVAEMVPGSTLDHPTYIANYIDAAGYACAAAPVNYCRSNLGQTPSATCSDGVNDVADIATFDRWDICKIAADTLPAGKVRVLGSGWRLSIVVEWDSAKARTDLGQKNNVNGNCNAIVADPQKNCIILEILP